MPESLSPPVNEQVFSVDTLLKYMGNDDKALAVVSKIVRDACAPGMEPILRTGEAMRDQRLYDAGRILHGVRGSVGTLGTKRMVSASLALEQALADARTEDLPALYDVLQLEYQRVLEAADAWLRAIPGGAGLPQTT